MQKQTSQAYVTAILSSLNITLRKINGEFRVNYKGGRESSAYYTDDLQDAFDTGKAMHYNLPAREGLIQTVQTLIA